MYLGECKPMVYDNITIVKMWNMKYDMWINDYNDREW